MNFLAHMYLSGDDTRIMVGNFIGDFVKGRNRLKDFDPTVAKGIELHRMIDAFTDTHPIVSESKNRLRPKYRHYAGVIVDVFYDHLLAVSWSDYHDTPLPDFAAHVYHTMEQHHSILPEGVKYMLPYMIRGNWLVNYAHLEGIHGTLTGMSRRTTHESKMEEAVKDLEQHFASFKLEFDSFFPALVRMAKAYLEGIQY